MSNTTKHTIIVSTLNSLVGISDLIMARDPNNTSRWVARRKVDDYLEYLVSRTSWNPDKRFAKIFDAQKEARAFLKESGFKGTVRKYQP